MLPALDGDCCQKLPGVEQARVAQGNAVHRRVARRCMARRSLSRAVPVLATTWALCAASRLSDRVVSDVDSTAPAQHSTVHTTCDCQH